MTASDNSVTKGIKVIDVDTHLTEPHDLWTSRAPKGWEDRLPAVREVDGQPTWIVGEMNAGRAGASSVIRRDGSKVRGGEFIQWQFEDAHLGAYDVDARLEVMDGLGIWAHIVYPNGGVVGFGGDRVGNATDPAKRLMIATIYKDAMAEMQEASNQRLFPMGIVPYWDIVAALVEIDRIDRLGLRGVNISSDPQEKGLPDLADSHWDPVWEACADRGLPVNFHIGPSETSLSWFGSNPWPSFDWDRKLAVGSTMMFMSNARTLSNILCSGILERHPSLHFVSVESGIGWLPFLVRALDYQMFESAPSYSGLSMLPSEYFRRQIHGCFWFEAMDPNLASIVHEVGENNVMFETDFPHPTCLYPDSLGAAAPGLEASLPKFARRSYATMPRPFTRSRSDFAMQADSLVLLSLDAHICEPADMFKAHVPDRYRDRAPLVMTDPDGRQPWCYGDVQEPNLGLNAAAGKQPEMLNIDPSRHDEMRSGRSDSHERARDMSAAVQLAGLNLPNWPGFAAPVLSQGSDRDVNLAMIQAFNDWHTGEWCAAYSDRFIPCSVLPFWEADIPAAELRWMAAKGCHALTFSESSTALSAPSIHSGGWDPRCAASDEGTVFCCHVASSKGLSTTSDAPASVSISLTAVAAACGGDRRRRRHPCRAPGGRARRRPLPKPHGPAPVMAS